MKKIILTSVILITFSFLMYMCTDENNPLSNDPVIDPITNQWVNEADSNHIFNFNTLDTLRGIIFGDEDHPDFGFSELHGFFDRLYVEFDVLRPDGRLKFKGSFINNNRLELQSSEGRLVLLRGG